MFGLSTRELLANSIINSSINHIQLYKQLLRNNISLLNNASEEETQSILAEIRKSYFDVVTNSVVNSFQISSPIIAGRIQLAMFSPSLCGYDDINLDSGIMAGSLFAICFYAMKSKIASPKDCVRLNHLQHNIMEKALSELDDEL